MKKNKLGEGWDIRDLMLWENKTKLVFLRIILSLKYGLAILSWSSREILNLV